MSDLAARLAADQTTAMKARDSERLGVIRRARAAVKNAEIDTGGPLDDDGVIRSLKTLAKQHRESIEQFRAGGREDLAAKEEAELAILEDYLPAQLDEAAVEAVVREVIAAEGVTEAKDLGRVMKGVMARLGAQADGKTVNRIARSLLGG